MDERQFLYILFSFSVGLVAKIVWDWLISGRMNYDKFVSRKECEKCAEGWIASIEQIEKMLEKINERIEKIEDRIEKINEKIEKVCLSVILQKDKLS